MIITEKQIKQIENLANNGYAESLIAYGADMHREGILKGAIIAIAGIAVVQSIKGIAKHVKNHKNK